MKKTIRLTVIVCIISGLASCDAPGTKAQVDAQVTEEVTTAPVPPVDVELSAEPDTAEPNLLLDHISERWTGDLAGITERGFIRILTVQNPLFFTFDGVEMRGLAPAMAQQFEKHLAEEIGKVRSPTAVLIPVARDMLLKGLVEGRGDIAIGNLTTTPERSKLVDFSLPTVSDISELVVTGPAATGVTSFDDLVEPKLYLRQSSSYFEHMAAFNAERRKAGKKSIPVVAADEYLEDYDLLDLVNAGLIPAIVMDSHKAAFWTQLFPDIVVHKDLAIHRGNQVAWAVRKGSPELLASVNAFSKKVRKGTLLGNIFLKRYMTDASWLNNILTRMERYREVEGLIKRYSARYDFDWLMIVAQAYQESRFDQSKESSAGALGIMQVLPSTAAGKVVGIPDISAAEDNIHAGVKYLHWLRDRYFSSDEIEPLDRILFSFAAYNAGPRNTARARKRTAQLGLDPNRWFGNVEIGMYRAVSGEPVTYVRNIYKYYITYRQLELVREKQEKALQRLN
jgi:membrane-bound lytic murein transglycosylase MltF